MNGVAAASPADRQTPSRRVRLFGKGAFGSNNKRVRKVALARRSSRLMECEREPRVMTVKQELCPWTPS